MKETLHYRWVILALFFFVQTISSMAVFAFGPLAPSLQENLGITRAQVGMFSSAIYLGMVLFSTHAGWLTDRYGIRLFLSVGLGATGVLFLILALSQSFLLSLLIVFLAGIGYQFVNPTTLKALIFWFPPRLRGTAIGIKQAGVSFGGAIASVILPLLILYVGWQGSIAFIGISILASVLIILLLYREPLDDDFVKGKKSAGIRLMGVALVLRNRNLLLLSASGGMYGISAGGFYTYLILYLKETFSVSIVMAGSFLAIAQMGVVAGRILWGTISDSFFGGRRKVPCSLLGFSVALMSMVTIFILPLSPYQVMYVIFALFGFSLGYNGIYLTFMAKLGGEMAATSVGFGAATASLGIVIGTPVFGYIADKTASYNLAWGYLSIVAFIGGVLALFIKEEGISGIHIERA